MAQLKTMRTIIFILVLITCQLDARQFVDKAEQFNAIAIIKRDAVDYIKKAPLGRKVTRFVFVRHGESTSNVENSMAGRTLDVDLTARGILQAQEVGELLANIHWDAVYASPMVRTHRTAELIAHCQDNEIIDDVRLYERYYGPYEGATEEEYAPVKELEKQIAGPKVSFRDKFLFKAHFDMESMVEIFERTLSFLIEVQQERSGQLILCATHNGPMKALFLMEAYERGSIVDYRAFDLGNCALLVIDVNSERADVKASKGLKFK